MIFPGASYILRKNVTVRILNSYKRVLYDLFMGRNAYYRDCFRGA